MTDYKKTLDELFATKPTPVEKISQEIRFAKSRVDTLENFQDDLQDIDKLLGFLKNCLAKNEATFTELGQFSVIYDGFDFEHKKMFIDLLKSWREFLLTCVENEIKGE